MSAPQQSQCRDVAGLLVFYSCGETSEQENALIEKHLAACSLCATQLSEERGLHESLMEALQASEQSDTGGILLSQCRSELAEALDDLSAPPLQERWRHFGWLRRSMVMHPVLNGALLVLFGVAVGTQLLPWISSPPRFQFQRSNSECFPRGALHRMINSQRWPSRESVPRRSPMAAPGTLQVRMRTEEPLVLSGSVDDPDLRRVLTYVIENGDQTDTGVRLDCLEALRARHADLDVRRALLYAARKDQNPAVRMKALESLRDAVADTAVREALIDALEHDANPGVRVEAVNLLVRSLEPGALDSSDNAEPVLAPDGVERPLDPSMQHVVRTLQELQRSDPNRYVRLRSAAALRQIAPREVQ